MFNGKAERLRFGHFATACIATGKIACGGCEDFHSETAAFFQIVPDDRIAVHPGIHGGRYDFRTFAGEKSSRQHIVSDASRDLADDVGRGRGN